MVAAKPGAFGGSQVLLGCKGLTIAVKRLKTVVKQVGGMRGERQTDGDIV
jgi:hypothetical protein